MRHRPWNFQAYHIRAPVIFQLFFDYPSVPEHHLRCHPRCSAEDNQGLGWVTAREGNVDTRRQEKHDERSSAKYPRWAYTSQRSVISRNIAYVAYWRRLTPSHFTNDQTHHDSSDSPIAQPCTRRSPRYSRRRRAIAD